LIAQHTAPALVAVTLVGLIAGAVFAARIALTLTARFAHVPFVTFAHIWSNAVAMQTSFRADGYKNDKELELEALILSHTHPFATVCSHILPYIVNLKQLTDIYG
jgi:hypothetical protein